VRALQLTSVAVLGFTLTAACNNETTLLITTTCKALQKYFVLTDGDYRKCLSDDDYRQRLSSRRDAQWAQNISDSHNQKLKIILPKRSPEVYVRISRVSELPLKSSVNFSRTGAERHVGERYVIAGTLLDEANGSDKHTLLLYADTDKERKDPRVIAAESLAPQQSAFISDHCWINTARYSSSMCHGDVYISVQREPKGFFITQELDGAAFTPSSAETVLGIVTGQGLRP
jgi:hypothetical protein